MAEPTPRLTPAQAARRIRRAQIELGARRVRMRAAQDQLHEEIRAGLRAGLRQSDIVQQTGYTREHIRRIGLGGQ